MLKIRLSRIGGKKRPFYRIVVVDERAKRTGAYVELLGTYNPLTEPKEIKIDQARVDHWIKQGAQMSVGFLRVIGKAPQRPPRKAKKEKKEEAPAVAPTAEAPKAEEPKTEEPAKEGTAPEEPAKSSESEAVSEVQSAPEEVVSEAESTAPESSDQTKPSGASTTDEQATNSPAEPTPEDKKE